MPDADVSVPVCPTQPPESIDAVYTWVDARDPRWRAEMEGALEREGTAAAARDARPCRYRCHDELRYSLRSLDRFAPWIRKIYLVTADQWPAWLQQGDSRVEVVSHESIFPDPGCLPTFNSHAIEANLHRIPGLSRHFLYFNDDLFLGRPCNLSDFVQGDGGIAYFEQVRLDVDLHPRRAMDRACANTRERVARTLGTEPLQYMPAHTPQLYDTAAIAHLEERFAEDFASTREHRFRCADDFVLRIAHAALALSRDRGQRLLDWGSADYAFLPMRGNPVMRLRDLVYLGRLRPRFFCLNDDLPAGWRGSLMAAAMRAFLERYFPNPAGCEAEGSTA